MARIRGKSVFDFRGDFTAGRKRCTKGQSSEERHRLVCDEGGHHAQRDGESDPTRETIQTFLRRRSRTISKMLTNWISAVETMNARKLYPKRSQLQFGEQCGVEMPKNPIKNTAAIDSGS